MLDANSNIEIYRNNIQIRNSSLLLLIVGDHINHMAQLHKQQLIQISSGFQFRHHLSRTDFGSLKSIFERYADALRERNSHDPAFLTRFSRCILEAATFEKRIEELVKLQQSSSAYSNSNFIVEAY